MKKLFLIGSALLFITVTGFKAPENIEEIDPCGAVAKFKMNNGGVYANGSSNMRFVAQPIAGNVTYHWDFSSGQSFNTSTNILEKAVSEANLPIGTSTVTLSHTITFPPDGVCHSGPNRTQNVTRVAL